LYLALPPPLLAVYTSYGWNPGWIEDAGEEDESCEHVTEGECLQYCAAAGDARGGLKWGSEGGWRHKNKEGKGGGACRDTGKGMR